ncbi:MAG: hypothetical protein ACT4PU_11150 [Planctomycetota bacterium]
MSTALRAAALTLGQVLLLAAEPRGQLSEFSWSYSGDPSGFGAALPTALLIVGPANDACTTPDTFAFLSTTATESGTVTAYFSFENNDGGFGWWTVEDPGYIVNGVKTTVGPGDIFDTWAGEVSFAVEAGDSFGFGVISADCSFGPGVLTVTDFLFLPDAWQNLGHGLAGVYGVPPLVGLGTLVPGSAFTLSLVDAQELAPAFLVVGFSAGYFPFKGGVLVPSFIPSAYFVPLSTGPTGRIILSGLWPSGLPSGLELFLQYWIADAAGPAGFSASNAVSATLP